MPGLLSDWESGNRNLKGQRLATGGRFPEHDVRAFLGVPDCVGPMLIEAGAAAPTQRLRGFGRESIEDRHVAVRGRHGRHPALTNRMVSRVTIP